MIENLDLNHLIDLLNALREKIILMKHLRVVIVNTKKDNILPSRGKTDPP